MHDGRVGRDRTTDRIVGIIQVYDHYLMGLAHLLAHTNELVRLHGQSAEANVGHVYANVLELNVLLEFDGQCAACRGSHRHNVLI